MVEEAGSAGIKKHSVKHQLLKNMAPRYETTLKELASAIKVSYLQANTLHPYE